MPDIDTVAFKVYRLLKSEVLFSCLMEILPLMIIGADQQADTDSKYCLQKGSPKRNTELGPNLWKNVLRTAGIIFVIVLAFVVSSLCQKR